ncbi:MAG: tetratricopeptide repeat protein [Acidobacteria bacterium]|nr:MAG: tetratricopeptide repeat protein [Acidobacteriota bacterium]
MNASAPTPARLRRWTALFAAALLVAVPALAKKKKKTEHAELVGVVQGLDEQPLAGAEVRLTGPDGEVVYAGRTDEEGSFEVWVDNAAGEYQLHLAKDGYAPFDTPLELTAGEGYNFTFKLLDDASARKNEAIRAFNEGNELYRKGDVAAAKERFLAARDADPGLAPPYLALADVYAGEEDWQQAKEMLERYRDLAGEDDRVLRLAFQIYNALGDKENERRVLERLRGTEHARPLAARIYNQGVALLQQGDHGAAAERFRAAADLDPTLAEPLVGLASIQYNAGDYGALAPTLDKLLQLAPDNVNGLRLKFLLYDALGETDKAWEAFEAYQAAEPDQAADLLYQRADMDFRAGQTAAAQRALLRILDLVPDHPRAHYTLGLVYASTGDNAKAREHLSRFLELAPNDPEAPTAREMLPHLR